MREIRSGPVQGACQFRKTEVCRRVYRTPGDETKRPGNLFRKAGIRSLICLLSRYPVTPVVPGCGVMRQSSLE
jgi:hypothetical protein